MDGVEAFFLKEKRCVGVSLALGLYFLRDVTSLKKQSTGPGHGFCRAHTSRRFP